jgi:hypothetical protein
MDSKESALAAFGVLVLASGCGGTPPASLHDGSAVSDDADPSPTRKPPPAVFPAGLDDAATEDRDAGSAPVLDAPAGEPGRPPAAPDAFAPNRLDAAGATDLLADAPVPAAPDGCQIVSCDGMATRRDCCRAWYFFALDSEDRNQVQRNELVKSFSKGVDVRASYAFDRTGQDGAVGMFLDRPRRVNAIKVSTEWGGAAAGKPFVSAEALNGTVGCAYPVGLAGQAELARPLFCWGDKVFTPDRINIRIEARAPGPANIRVTALEIK